MQYCRSTYPSTVRPFSSSTAFYAEPYWRAFRAFDDPPSRLEGGFLFIFIPENSR